MQEMQCKLTAKQKILQNKNEGREIQGKAKTHWKTYERNMGLNTDKQTSELLKGK